MKNMSHSVKLSDNVVEQARNAAQVFNRSLAGQIEYWAKIGKLVEQNPDLNYELIKDIVIAQQEAKFKNLSEYKFDSSQKD